MPRRLYPPPFAPDSIEHRPRWKPIVVTCLACDGGKYRACPYCKGNGTVTIAANKPVNGHKVDVAADRHINVVDADIEEGVS